MVAASTIPLTVISTKVVPPQHKSARDGLAVLG